MDRVCIHIGLSLFTIKRMCETQERCIIFARTLT